MAEYLTAPPAAQRQHGLHERRLARRRGRLDDDRERLVQQPRHRAEVADQHVDAFAHDAARRRVLGDELPQARVAQERAGLLQERRREVRRGLLRRGLRLKPRLLQFLELAEHLAEIALQELGFQHSFPPPRR